MFWLRPARRLVRIGAMTISARVSGATQPDIAPTSVARLGRVLTDQEVLSAVANANAGPVFAKELGERLGLAEDRVELRLASLVSLGYLEQLLTGKDGGYT